MALPTQRAAGDADPITDINTTPLIDVMLVLLVMLIITIPIQLHSLKLNLPVGTPPPSDTRPEVVKLDIDADSTVYWNGTPVGDRGSLQARLQQAAALPVQPEVHVRPDKAAPYTRFVEVMVDLHQVGLHKMGVVGSEQFIDE
jgi:biopolymer transport protein ExbD